MEGLTLIPYAGLQSDEALFAAALYRPPGIVYSMRIIGHVRFPAMTLTYMGTLKAWLYKPVFAVFGHSIWSVRMPMLLAGAATIWLLFLLVRHVAGPRAAVVAAALLATDAAFLLTTCMDWGPVAIQHLLLVLGLLLLWRFDQSGRERYLLSGFFVFGLALWDKALFFWALGGIVTAAVVVFPRELRSRLTRRNLALAVVSMLIGAAPLVAFNVTRQLQTFRGNANLSVEDLERKAAVLRFTLDGSTLFGYIPRNEPPPQAAPPGNALEKSSVRLSELLGKPRRSPQLYACILALLLLPYVWRTPARRPMLFSLIFMAAAWVQMACTRGAGGSAHHTILIWPFPQVLAGIGLAVASRKIGRAGLPILIVLIAVVCASGVAVINQYLAQLVENGPALLWTDAIDPLSAYLRTSPARHMYMVDWGFGGLRVLNAGELPLDYAPYEIPGDPKSHRTAVQALAAPGAIFLEHTPGNECVQSEYARMASLAQSGGYRPEILEVISDRFDRPIFRVYRYVRESPAPAR